MKIVLYGAGFRGKTILNYMGKDRIVAFIDKDEKKQGTMLEGVPIISLETYKKKYLDCYIVITPVYDLYIGEMLQKNGIFHYEFSRCLPAEFFGRGNFPITGYDEVIKTERNMIFYGLNAFSIILQNEAFERFGKKIPILPEKGCNDEKVRWAQTTAKNSVLEEFDYEKEMLLLNTTVNEEDGFLENIKEKDKINVYFYSVDIGYYENNELKKLHNQYLGKRCFIVATGPSLRNEDLLILSEKGEFTFSVNEIYRFNTNWKPTAYVISDGLLIDSNIQKIDEYDVKYKFVGDSGINYWDKTIRKDAYKIHAIPGNPYCRFETDISNKICICGTVVTVCLQLAVYMGFKEIYLLGTDCNYVIGSRNNHAYQEEEKDNKQHDIEAMFQFYKVAKEFAEENGIKIYNATRGGMLEIFERVSFDSLFN